MLTAQNTVEEIQRAIDGGGVVEFAPGVYENAHFRITKQVHLIGHGAMLVGGERICWQRESDGLLACGVSADMPIRELVVGGALRMRCRLPESGYMQHETVYPHRWLGTSKGGWDVKPTPEQMVTMQVKPGTLDGLTLHSAEATIVHSWSDSLLTVSQAVGDTVIFGEAGDHPVGGFGVQDFCLWNVPEAFVLPGTFYHDVPAGKLYYRPLPGEGEETIAYLPMHTSIFYADGPVENVEIEGFVLTAAAAPRVKAGFGALGLTGAIDFSEPSDAALHDLTICATGGYGVRINGAAGDARIERCEVCHTGAGGIRLGLKPGGKKGEIVDNYVHHVGLYQPSALGISAGNCHIRHNEVCHTSYSAVNCGGDDFVVEKNLVHDTMEVLNDGAAIYSFGSHNGVLRGNLAYGIRIIPGHHLRVAYYLDELSRGWLVERNVAVDCDFPNHNHMCGTHLYRENLFVNEQGGLKISMQNADAPNRYIGNVFSAGKDISIIMPENMLEAFEENAYHSADGEIILKLQKQEGLLETKPMEIGSSNRQITPVHFEKNERVFEAAGVRIDLSDVGVRR